MSKTTAVSYTRIVGASKLAKIIIAHDLYLPKGLMLDKMAQAYLHEPKEVFGYIASVGDVILGVGVYAPREDNPKRTGDGMVFVRKQSRGRGIAEELVKRLLSDPCKLVFFYPWDGASIRFYRKLYSERILTDDNFHLYELALIKSGAKFLTGQVHSQCRQAERNQTQL